MGNAFEFKTIQDMERYYYGGIGAMLNETETIAKADAPITIGTTGVYNAVYGAKVWSILNHEANVFGVLPKVPWARAGHRVITARSATMPFGGRAEAATLPDSVKPTISVFKTTPKTNASVYELSELERALAEQSEDDVGPDYAQLVAYAGIEHAEDINVALTTQNGTLAGDQFDSIDRVVASYSELSNCRENDEITSYSAGDLDIYGLDRDGGASFADAYVNHNSSTLRSLTDEIIRDVLVNVQQNGGQPTLWLTGWDTYSAITGLYDIQVRYSVLGQTTAKIGVNGIQTQDGIGVGINVATLYGIPLIISKNVVQDAQSSGGISRLYLLDTSNPEGDDYPRLCFKVLKPTQFFEAGITSGTPFGVNKLSDKIMYRTAGELTCRHFKAQGKARDLKK